MVRCPVTAIVIHHSSLLRSRFGRRLLLAVNMLAVHYFTDPASLCCAAELIKQWLNQCVVEGIRRKSRIRIIKRYDIILYVLLLPVTLWLSSPTAFQECFSLTALLPLPGLRGSVFFSALSINISVLSVSVGRRSCFYSNKTNLFSFRLILLPSLRFGLATTRWHAFLFHFHWIIRYITLYNNKNKNCTWISFVWKHFLKEKLLCDNAYARRRKI